MYTLITWYLIIYSFIHLFIYSVTLQYSSELLSYDIFYILSLIFCPFSLPFLHTHTTFSLSFDTISIVNLCLLALLQTVYYVLLCHINYSQRYLWSTHASPIFIFCLIFLFIYLLVCHTYIFDLLSPLYYYIILLLYYYSITLLLYYFTTLLLYYFIINLLLYYSITQYRHPSWGSRSDDGRSISIPLLRPTSKQRAHCNGHSYTVVTDRW